MPDPDRPLRADLMLRTLIEFGVDFVVVGGIAVQAHGYLRGTGDLDVVPRPSLLNLSRLAEALMALDARPVRATGVDLSDPHLLRRMPMIPADTSAGRLDILNIEHLSGAPGSYDELRERALVVDLEGLEIPVSGLDDLLRMKRSAGREQDRTDIAALTRTDDELAAEST